MDNFKDFIANRVVMNISAIRESAARHGGECTWHFSQCKDPVRSVIAKNDTTKEGICELLAAKWVCEEHHGRSLKTYLAGPTGHRSQIDLARLSLLAQAFGTGYGNQSATTEAWMRANQVPPRAGLGTDMGGATVLGAPKIDVDDDLLGDLRRKTTRRGVTLPLLALVSVGEHNRFLGKMAHATAVRLDTGAYKATYFDPNYGEFRFPSFDTFRSWFISYFRKSHYATFMGTYYELRYF